MGRLAGAGWDRRPRCSPLDWREEHRGRGPFGTESLRSALRLVDVLSAVAVDIVFGEDVEAGLNSLCDLLALERCQPLVHPVDADLVRVLRDQALNCAGFQLRNLIRTGIEADHLDLILLVRLADTGTGPGRGEQVRGEHADDVGVLSESGGDQPGRNSGIVVAVLDAKVGE